MRLVIAKTLRKGDRALVNATGREIVLAEDPEFNPIDKLVMVTDCFDGKRYMHTQIRPFPQKSARRAK